VKLMRDKIRALAVFALIIFSAIPAWADPRPWQLGMLEPISPVMRDVNHLHDLMLIIITVITLLVLALLIYVMVKFNDKANPVPSKTTHNSVLEVLWTALPVLLLVAIAVPSLRLLYFQDRTADADFTIKVVGHQWYWSYEFPDHGNFAFDSFPIPDADIKPGQVRLLEVDNRLVVPVNKNVRVLMTSGDVIHSWSVPQLLTKTDAVPGRTNETWFRAEREGVFRGQCYELCGVGHAFMPVVIEVVSEARFAEWIAEAQKKFAMANDRPVRVAGVVVGP
jgi:cytochrome c oxidase subunit 2